MPHDPHEAREKARAEHFADRARADEAAHAAQAEAEAEAQAQAEAQAEADLQAGLFDDIDLPASIDDLDVEPAGQIRPTTREEDDHAMSKENEDTDLVDYEPLIDHAIRTGFFADVPNAVYQSHPAISRSMIAKFADCEKYLQHELATREVWETQDEDPSKAQKLGTAVHEYIFEPQVAKERYKVAPDQCEATKSDGDRCSYSPSGYYTDEDADEGQFLCGTHSRGREPDDAVEVLPMEEASRIEGMYEALFGDAEAKRLLWDLPGRSELSLVWRHESGLPLRARLDRLVCEEPSGDGEPTDPRERWGIVDLKTCRSVHPKDVQRQLGKGYWLQPVIYAMGVRELTGVWPSFRFVFVESQPPHVVQTYAMDSVQLDQIRERAEQYCWDIAAAIEAEDFAGYTTDDVAVTAMKRWDLERYGMQP